MKLDTEVKKKLLVFDPEIKKKLISSAVLLDKLASLLDSKSIQSVIVLINRDSQSLMHITIQNFIAKELKVEVKELTKKP